MLIRDLTAAGFLDATSEGAVSLARDGTILFHNRRFAEMVGMPGEALAGRRFIRFVAPADRERVMALWQSVESRSGLDATLIGERLTRPAHLSARLACVDHAPVLCLAISDVTTRMAAPEARPVLGSVAQGNSTPPLRRRAMPDRGRCDEEISLAEGTDFTTCTCAVEDASGACCKAIWTAPDGGGHAHVEAAVPASNDGFRATFEQAAVGIAHVSPDGRWLRVNPKLCDILGYSRDELLQHRCQEIGYGEDRDTERSLIGGLLAGERNSFSAEKRCVRKDGRVIWTHLTVSLVREDAGAPCYFIWMLLDIQDRKAAVEELRALSERHLALLGAVPEIIVEVDASKVYTWSNAAGFAFFGDDLIGKTADHYFEGEQATYQVVQPLFQGVEDAVYVESWQRRRDGEKRLLAWHCRALRDGQGKLVGALSSARDITERQQAEQALRERVKLQDRLAKIAATVPGMIASFRRAADGSTSIPYASPALEEIFGVQPQDVADDAMPVLSVIHPEDIARLEESIGQSARTMQPWREELRVGHPRKGEIWVEGHMMPQRDADGGTLWHGFLQDITERKRSELALRESEQTLERAQAMAHVGSWIAEVANRTFTLSAEAMRIMGLPAGRVDWDTVFSMTHPEDFARAEAAWEAALGGAPYDLEHRIVDDGRIKWLHVKAHVLFHNGRPVRAIGMTQDITEVREAQRALEAYRDRLEDLAAGRTAALHQQTRYLRALVDNFPFWVWLKDAENRYLATNRATAEACRLTVEELVGKTDLDLWSPELAEAYRADDAQVMASRQAKTVEESFSNGDSTVWIETYNAPMLDEDGTVLGTVGFARDITERKATEAAREAALEEAERLARVKSEFLANMSHEIRTPLNAVLGLAQVGLRESGAGKAQATFARILDSGQLLLGLINDILDFSKIEAGKLALERKPFDLGEVVDRAVDVTAARAYAKDLEFRVEESADLPTACTGDALRLSQVLVNLLSNAVKFTERGRVILAVSRTGGDLVFTVADSGIGMTPEQLTRLFTPFEQADGTTTRRFGGTGLGLAISKRLADMMGGAITVESRLREGTVFELRLPLAEAAPSAPSADSTVILAGLDEEEARALCVALAQRGARAAVVSPEAAFDAPAGLVVLTSDVLAQGKAIVTAEAAVARGQRLAVACTPGAGHAIPPALRERSCMIERPLRARHLLAAAANRAAPGVAGAVGPRLTGLRVLSAEDIEANRLVLEEILAQEGARTTSAEHGRAALGRLLEEGRGAYDVVLMDIQMPEMDGYEAARRIRALAPDLPVIGLTAHAMPEERERCRAAGMVEHVAKPIDVEVLVAAILRHAARRPQGSSVQETRRTDDVGRGGRVVVGAAASCTAAVVDWAGLETRFPGKSALIDKLAATVLDSHGATPTKLREAAQCQDYATLAFVAHSLKGMGGNLMARRLAEQAKETDGAARQGHPDAIVLAVQLAQALEEVLAELAVRVPQALRSSGTEGP